MAPAIWSPSRVTIFIIPVAVRPRFRVILFCMLYVPPCHCNCNCPCSCFCHGAWVNDYRLTTTGTTTPATLLKSVKVATSWPRVMLSRMLPPLSKTRLMARSLSLPMLLPMPTASLTLAVPVNSTVWVTRASLSSLMRVCCPSSRARTLLRLMHPLTSPQALSRTPVRATFK